VLGYVGCVIKKIHRNEEQLFHWVSWESCFENNKTIESLLIVECAQ
jgi:hypothetical protein